MKQINKNGFTLIELLAVIIILAIVALIATPIILDVVEDARKSAGLSESNMILSGINNYCATEEIKSQMNSEYEIICKSGMLKNDVEKMVNLGNAEILEIEYTTKLTWLKVKSNGKIYSLQDNAMVEGDLEKPEAKYAVGDLLKVQVSDSETQNIYVLEVNEDEIVGILDRNLPGGPVAWISEEDITINFPSLNLTYEEIYEYLNSLGAITANKVLNERTSSWNKVTQKYLPEATTLLKLTGYYKELEASGETANWESKYSTDFDNFMMSNESGMECSSGSECREAITAAGGSKYLLPELLTINLATTGDNNAKYGYWTSTPMDYSILSLPYFVWLISVQGNLNYFEAYTFDNFGVRPVIHISQSNILEKLEVPEYVTPEENGGEIVGE